MKADSLAVGFSNSNGFALMRPTQLIAPQQSVEQFNAILGGLHQALASGESKLKPLGEKDTALEGDLLSETAVTVRKAEVSEEALEREIRKSIHHTDSGKDLNANTVKEITYQQTVRSFVFVSVRMVANKADNISEEVTSLTKGQ